MPNHRMPQFIVTALKDEARQRAKRTIEYACADFPLNVEQIQMGIMPRHTVEVLRDLEAGGFGLIQKQSILHVGLLRAPDANSVSDPSLALGYGLCTARSCLVWLDLAHRQSVFAPYDTHYISHYDMNRKGWFNPATKAFVPLDLGELDEDTRARLVTWVQRAIRAQRFHDIAIHTVWHVLDNHAPTSQHLLAIWPGLATILPDNPVYHEWREHFRNPVRRNLKAYLPGEDVMIKYANLIRASDTVLVAGGMYEPFVQPQDQPMARIAYWERLSNDKVYE